MLVGNKTDLAGKRVVSYDEGLDFATKNEILFLECSAKSSYNVDNIFIKSSELIIKKIDQGVIDGQNESLGIKIGA